MEEKNFNKIICTGVILGVCFIIGLSINAGMNYRARQLNNTLSVTGSAKMSVVSDTVKWKSSFSRTVSVSGLETGYSQMKKDEDAVLAFLKGQGISDENITISPISMYENYKYNSDSPTEYVLTQSVTVESQDVDKITQVAKNTQEIINKGVIFSSDAVEYYYSKLPELRVSLLSDAIKDAGARAEKIAESSGRKVGSIQSASMGVVQVLAPNSVDISDYGSYDTQTVDKDVMVTVKASFVLK
jgi:uncharacterized protein